VAPVNETAMDLFPEGLKALKQVAKQVGLDVRGAYLTTSMAALMPRTIGSACSMRA
jgi:hypothetical protein